MLEKQFRKNFNDALALYIQTLEGMVNWSFLKTHSMRVGIARGRSEDKLHPEKGFLILHRDRKKNYLLPPNIK